MHNQRREGKSTFNALLKRSHRLNWLKGYMVALNNVLNKADFAKGLGLKDDDVVNFITAESKAMIAAADEEYNQLKALFNDSKSHEVGEVILNEWGADC